MFSMKISESRGRRRRRKRSTGGREEEGEERDKLCVRLKNKSSHGKVLNAVNL